MDKMSSAHVYIRLHKGQTIDDISEGVLEDCVQLVKANSIQGKLSDYYHFVYFYSFMCSKNHCVANNHWNRYYNLIIEVLCMIIKKGSHICNEITY